MAKFTIRCETCNQETTWEHSNERNLISWENRSYGNTGSHSRTPWIYAKSDGIKEEINAIKIVCNNCKSYVIIV